MLHNSTTTSIRITHTSADFVDIPVHTINRYPDSPFYYYVTNYSSPIIPFSDICQNLDTDFTFDLFRSMCSVICGETQFIDSSIQAKTLLKNFNLVDPVVYYFYEKQHKKLVSVYDKINNFINTRGTYIEFDYEQYVELYSMIVGKYADIIPVQILWVHFSYSYSILAHISIYNGLPIYNNKIGQCVLSDDISANGNVDINDIRYRLYSGNGKDQYCYCGERDIFTDNIKIYMNIVSAVYTKYRFNQKLIYKSQTPRYVTLPTNINIDAFINNIKDIVNNNKPHMDTHFKTICGFVHLSR